MNFQNPTAGAVFHRCALQVNPHNYRKVFRGQQRAGGHLVPRRGYDSESS